MPRRGEIVGDGVAASRKIVDRVYGRAVVEVKDVAVGQHLGPKADVLHHGCREPCRVSADICLPLWIARRVGGRIAQLRSVNEEPGVPRGVYRHGHMVRAGAYRRSRREPGHSLIEPDEVVTRIVTRGVADTQPVSVGCPYLYERPVRVAGEVDPGGHGDVGRPQIELVGQTGIVRCTLCEGQSRERARDPCGRPAERQPSLAVYVGDINICDRPERVGEEISRTAGRYGVHRDVAARRSKGLERPMTVYGLA